MYECCGKGPGDFLLRFIMVLYSHVDPQPFRFGLFISLRAFDALAISVLIYPPAVLGV